MSQQSRRQEKLDSPRPASTGVGVLPTNLASGVNGAQFSLNGGGSLPPKAQPTAHHENGNSLSRAGIERSQSSQAALRHSASAANLTDLFGTPLSQVERQRVQKSIETKFQLPRPKAFELKDIVPFITQGAKMTVEDDFSICFEAPPYDPWNWNFYLYVLWMIGIVLRYFVIFPIRLFIFIVGNIIFALVFACIKFMYKKNERQRILWERKALKFLAGVWICSWTGVIKYHGVIPKHEPKQIYVANHSSMIDYIILQQVTSFAAVGQKHGGWVGWFQDNVLHSLGGLWFDRKERKDRKIIAQRIQEYISTVDFGRNRLLVFPEGTCVNNQYCVQFKRGAFEYAETICPIAIKYNNIFVDAFWNSRKRSFQMHLFDLMTSWACVCDVWYLEPQQIRDGETIDQFAQRVKEMIAKTAGIKSVEWNGYLKYFRPSKRFVEKRQKLFAESLLHRDDEKSAEFDVSSILDPNNVVSNPESNILIAKDAEAELRQRKTSTAVEEKTKQSENQEENSNKKDVNKKS